MTEEATFYVGKRLNKPDSRELQVFYNHDFYLCKYELYKRRKYIKQKFHIKTDPFLYLSEIKMK